MHSWDYTDSEYVLYVGVGHKVTEFTGRNNIQMHTDTQLYILAISKDLY